MVSGFDVGVVLETRRLRLRPPEKGDLNDLLAAGADPEIQRWMAWAPDQTVESALEWCTTPPDPLTSVTFTVTADDQFVGAAGLHRADWLDGRVEVGYWIAPWARHRGYAVEAARGVAGYAFEKGMFRIELLAAAANLASQGVALKAGFIREGVARDAILTGTGRADAVQFSLLEGEL